MAANERRKETRIKVRFPCDLALGRRRASGTVLDLSAGGLSVTADAKLDQGDVVFVRLHPKGRSSVDIEALVWNVRRIKSRGKKGASTRLGLVLSEAPAEFLELLKSRAPADVAKPAQSAQECSPEPQAAGDAEPPPAERRFRVRVKQSATTRTRVILVFAESAEDAAERALAEAGAGWSLLEVAAR
jgi:hypothetical protein